MNNFMDKIIIGSEVEFSKTFTIKNVLDFSRISEDNNPIHIDEEKASESIFGKRVVHGVLLLSMFSKILVLFTLEMELYIYPKVENFLNQPLLKKI